MKTPNEIAHEAVNAVAQARNASDRTVSLIVTVAMRAIEADRAQLKVAAFSNARDLNELDREITNPEYLRGQVELIADLFGIEKEAVYTELGVEEL